MMFRALLPILVGIVLGLVGYFWVERDQTTFGMDGVLFGWILLGILSFLGSGVLLLTSDHLTAPATAMLVVFGMLTSVIGKIIYDSTLTDMPHSIWPLEVGVISLIVLPMAFFGVGAVMLIRRKQVIKE